jgi:hypothetical protein
VGKAGYLREENRVLKGGDPGRDRQGAVHVAGIRIDPDGAWMMPAARN